MISATIVHPVAEGAGWAALPFGRLPRILFRRVMRPAFACRSRRQGGGGYVRVAPAIQFESTSCPIAPTRPRRSIGFANSWKQALRSVRSALKTACRAATPSGGGARATTRSRSVSGMPGSSVFSRKASAFMRPSWPARIRTRARPCSRPLSGIWAIAAWPTQISPALSGSR